MVEKFLSGSERDRSDDDDNVSVGSGIDKVRG
jgi:hypothetical protein